MQTLVFDLEISRPVDPKTGGWETARNGGCGISCAVIWDSVIGHPLIYDQHTMEECAQHIESAERVVTWNGKAFDQPCLSGFLGRNVEFPDHYDMLEKVWQAIGKRKKGYSLGDVCQRTLHRGKIDTGENAPRLFAEGRHAELHSYCVSDTYLTRALYNHILECGHIVDVNGHELWLEQPMEQETNGSS